MRFGRNARSALAVATIAAGGFAGVAGTSVQAEASQASSARSAGVSASQWDSRVCLDLASYERHRSPSRFGRIVRDARHADTYLRFDVGGWERAGRLSRVWEGFVWADCNTPAD